ncbi:hypothetical protein [Winogradskyella haliclonae]|uniref:Uncharacterized protein n=1 Tax=Winogradskyella haliclonae TaxID=2048558 RepID=A0ABQ2C5S7_9FLAO|nr:hypothetical protein [Winogradskyella haliclonae]GGI58448.1 hypothetical protein GCM10011444_27570 [Winogradskyella haliclonae]
MMTNNKIILCFLITLIFSCTPKQEKLNINSIKKQSAAFLKEKGHLDNVNIENHDRFSLIEIKNNGTLTENEKGIYRLVTHTSHVPIYAVTLSENEIKFYNINNLSKSLSEIVAFLDKMEISDEDYIIYLEKLIKMYKNNNVLRANSIKG